MASSSKTGEEPPAPSVVANAPPLPSTEAKMIVATGRDHCQQLKDMLCKEDPSTMVVVMASSHPTSTTPNQAPSPPPLMYPGLLAVASYGSWEKLQAFLNGDPHPTSGYEIIQCCCCRWTKRTAKPRPTSSDGTVRCCCFLWKTRKSFPPEEPHPTSSDRAIGSSAIQPPSSDLEAHPRVTILDGVTFEGDTFLHVMATNSVGDHLIEDEPGRIRSKAVELLFARNKKEDTPLHCAARADKSEMVSFLLKLARGKDEDADRVKALLETKNSSGWTVLHEAVHVGNNEMVQSIMKNDPDLARFPKDGTSPMYLAILLDRKIIAETLHKESGGVLSYSGPNGQNALHAAVLRGKGLTNMLLDWNNDKTTQRDENWKDLTIQRDEKGNTPLHYAASSLGQRAIRLRLLQANQDALYQPDKDGSFPIHVAASVNASFAISDFIKKSPRCAGLRDARGRTFLHVAAEKKHSRTVSYACRYKNGLSWIMNMQDNDGNTALHLVVRARGFKVFCAILANMHGNINLTNEKGETPRDIARYNVPRDGFYNNQNSEAKIHGALVICGAKKGICRQDYFEQSDIVQASQVEIRQAEMVKEATTNLCVGTVLIATVTFGATFAMPGGYRADDHTNGGTPTLAGRYAFDTFTLANALAFTTSTMATISLMCSGSPLLHLRSRSMHLAMAYYLMMISVKCLVAAFAIGTYMMLAPVAHKTAVAVCVLSSLVLLYQNMELIIKNIVCITPFHRRKGICFSFAMSVHFIVGNIVVEYWPIIVIFCSTLRSYHAGKTDSAIQPPTTSP